MLRNMINNIKKSVCKANEDFIRKFYHAVESGKNPFPLRSICTICQSKNSQTRNTRSVSGSLRIQIKRN